MDIVATILGQNWAFYSHRKLYDMVRTEARGASAVSEAERAWAELTKLMAESRQRIDQLLRDAGASWEGMAAESMAAGVTPLAQWTDDAGTAGRASATGVRVVEESFDYTANAMPEPVQPIGGSLGLPRTFADLFSEQTDQDQREREAQEAKQRAVELMNSYSSNAGSAVSGLGAFVPPQDVTVSVPPPQGSGGTVGHAAGSIAGPTDGDRGTGSGGGPSPRDGGGAPGSGDPGSPTTSSGQPASGVAPPAASGGQPTTGSSGPSAPAATPVPPADNPRTGAPVGGVGPVAGVPIERTAGRPGGGGARGPGSGHVGGPGTGERVPGGGAFRGSGPPAGGGPAGGRGAMPAATRAGAAGMFPPVPGAGARREEDEEHRSPDYLREYHDEFWDPSPPVAPAVIGGEQPAPQPPAEDET